MLANKYDLTNFNISFNEIGGIKIINGNRILIYNSEIMSNVGSSKGAGVYAQDT